MVLSYMEVIALARLSAFTAKKDLGQRLRTKSITRTLFAQMMTTTWVKGSFITSLKE